MERLKRIWAAICGRDDRTVNINRIEINIPKSADGDLISTAHKLADVFVELRRAGRAA